LTRRIYLIDCPGIVPTSAHDSQTATVLKGVLRVEALSTPSEHITELLTRIKPLYVARTYGLTIPYFVAPPERPAELNEREAKERARFAKSKGKESVEEKRVPGVKQNLGSIMQKNTFVAEDLRPLEGIDLEGESEDGRVQEEDNDEVADDDDEEEAEEDAPLAWGDVFVEERTTAPIEVASPGEEVEEDEEGQEWSGITSLPRAIESSGDESEEPAKTEKETRMTTNKKKAENFYTSANVKNKNRAKAALLSSLQGRNGNRNRERKRKR